MAEDTVERKAAEVVDLDTLDSSLVEEKIEINTDANPMEAPAPVNDGLHRVKLTGATDWAMAETKPNKQGDSTTYLKTQFSGIVVSEDPKQNNKRVFGRVNTLTYDGKNEMAYIILQSLGGSKNEQAVKFVKSLTNINELAKAFRSCVASEVIIQVETKWVAQYNAGTKEKPEYKTYLSGQAQFPNDGNGGKRHIVQVPKVGEISAQAVIQDYFPDKA